VRATALLRGNIKAAMLDIPNKNFVMSEEPGRFRSLPTPESAASDEVLFANTEWLKRNGQSAQVLLEGWRRDCSPRTAAARRPRGMPSSSTARPGSSRATRRISGSRTSGAWSSSTPR
jgi:hypothetical protein